MPERGFLVRLARRLADHDLGCLARGTAQQLARTRQRGLHAHSRAGADRPGMAEQS
jgi:hypothetical protein